jgi:hypothetical protein
MWQFYCLDRLAAVTVDRGAQPRDNIGGTIGTSPTPRAPNGWRGFGTSTITASIIGRRDLRVRACKSLLRD